mmetsp:Transcript_9705/g.15202  ORF Transcript_9705/g.15202 Transcript_9705/m.15202 type:complete len:81 (-) Transcript_9705:900-1142(-)
MAKIHLTLSDRYPTEAVGAVNMSHFRSLCRFMSAEVGRFIVLEDWNGFVTGGVRESRNTNSGQSVISNTGVQCSKLGFTS